MALKGLGYEILLFSGVALLLILGWIFLYTNYLTMNDVFVGLTDDEDTLKMLGYFERVIFFSLFFLILIGFIWVMQRSAGPGRGMYG